MSDDRLVVWMVKRGGLRRAMKAAGYLAAWGIAAEELGHDPSWSDYESYWNCSQSTHARESRAFRACFAELTVADVWHQLRPRVDTSDLDDATASVLAARWSA